MLFVVLLFGFAFLLSANVKTRPIIRPRLRRIVLTVMVAIVLTALIACGTTGSGTSPNSGGGSGSGGAGGSGSTGSGGGTTTTATSVSQVTSTTSSVAAGGSMTAMVTLNAAAPAGGAQVMLTSSNGSAASVPANIMVGSGQTSGNFTVSTGNVSSDTSVSITAAYNNTSAAIGLLVRAPVTPPAPITISISPASASVQSQASQQFTAAVSGSTNTAVSWTTSGGNITSTGLFTAPSVSATTTVNVFATSQADPSVVKAAQVTVTPLSAPPPSGGMYSGTGPVASWEAYQYLDTDGLYHQAILIFNSKGGYPVIGYSYYGPGCVDLGDTANDTWGPMGNGIWWFINKPQLVYVQWIWYNNATDKQILQQTPCIDYSGAPKYN